MLKPALMFFQLMLFGFTPFLSFAMQETASETYGPIKASESLWKIAHRIKPDKSLSAAQVAVAVFIQNPHAFTHNNVNGLQQGKTLSIPSVEKMHSVSSTTASEFLEQHRQAWKNRNKQPELHPMTADSLLIKTNVEAVVPDKLINPPPEQNISLNPSTPARDMIYFEQKTHSSEAFPEDRKIPLAEFEHDLSGSKNTGYRWIFYLLIFVLFVSVLLSTKKSYLTILKNQFANFRQRLIDSHLLTNVLERMGSGVICQRETATQAVTANDDEQSHRKPEEKPLLNKPKVNSPVQIDTLKGNWHVEFIHLCEKEHIKNFIWELSNINQKLSEIYQVIIRDKDNETAVNHFLMQLNMIKQISLFFGADYVYRYSSTFIELLQCQLGTEHYKQEQMHVIMSGIITCNQEIVKALEEKKLPDERVNYLIDKAKSLRFTHCPETKDTYIASMTSSF